jgi:hypothetical protein
MSKENEIVFQSHSVPYIPTKAPDFSRLTRKAVLPSEPTMTSNFHLVVLEVPQLLFKLPFLFLFLFYFSALATKCCGL